MSAARDPMTGAVSLAEDVLVFQSGAFALNSGVVLGTERGPGALDPGGPGGSARPALLLDPAYFPCEIDRIAACLLERTARAEHVVLTHSDWDHVVGPARWPKAAVVASSEFPRRTSSEGDRILEALEAFDRKLYVAREGSFALPEATALVGSPSDLVWGGQRVHLLPAGGHTPDGLMLLLRERGILFAGDHLSDREIPFVGDSVRAYRETLEQVRKMTRSGEIQTLVPGHGEICGAGGILERIEEDTDYLGRLDAWIHETLRSVSTLEGLLERCEEVVFRKGWDNPDVRAEHRSNVERHARLLGAPDR